MEETVPELTQEQAMELKKKMEKEAQTAMCRANYEQIINWNEKRDDG